MLYDINRLVFFLGGMDLEMQAIKEMLADNQTVYFSNNLQWGAKRSAYSNEIAALLPGQIPVFVELFPDIHYYGKSIVIDHHGYGKTDRLLKDDTIDPSVGKEKPTSIEQIADLLSITLTREQQLVSAYDKDFMKGLQSMKPSEEEIQQIISADFNIQGISPDDVTAAAKAIEDTCQEVLGKYCWVISENPKTIPVFMKLHEKHPDIKNYAVFVPIENTLHFSGEGSTVLQLIKKFREDKELPDTYWYGGALPERGYFGVNLGRPVQMREFYNWITNKTKNIISQHIFLFPFRIKSNNDNTALSFHEILKQVTSKREDGLIWEQKNATRSELDKKKNDDKWLYNEMNYFHEFTKKALFTTKGEKQDEIISYYLELVEVLDSKDEAKKAAGDFFITILNNDLNKILALTIDTVGLHLFETGIGVLSFTLYNYLHTGLEEVLLINDFGRRIYPQFIGANGIIDTKNAFLPDSIAITLKNNYMEYVFNEDDFITKQGRVIQYIYEIMKPIKEGQFIPILDDRMYTLCWLGNYSFIRYLSVSRSHGYNYEDNSDWYKYIYVDGKSIMVSSLDMKKRLINSATYPRFVGDGTLFGITRYSFMALTKDDWFGYNIIRNHMQKMYYQMAVLLLAQRASIVQFNEEIRHISREIKPGSESELTNTVRDVRKLNERIIRFSNRMCFDEVSPQEQGIEIYRIAHENMGIPAQLQSLRGRMEELGDYVELLDIQRHQDQMNREQNLIKNLTLLGTVFLPVSLWGTVLSIIFGGKDYFFSTGRDRYLQWMWITPVRPYMGYIFFTVFTVFTGCYIKALFAYLGKSNSPVKLKKLATISLRKVLCPFNKTWQGIIFWILLVIFFIIIIF